MLPQRGVVCSLNRENELRSCLSVGVSAVGSGRFFTAIERSVSAGFSQLGSRACRDHGLGISRNLGISVQSLGPGTECKVSVLSTVISSHFSTKLPMQIPRASLMATVALAATATAQLPVHQTLLATSATSWWAKNAVDLDDQNGDGVRDFAVATVHYNSSAPDYVEIYSGATGQLIRTLAELSAASSGRFWAPQHSTGWVGR